MATLWNGVACSKSAVDALPVSQDLQVAGMFGRFGVGNPILSCIQYFQLPFHLHLISEARSQTVTFSEISRIKKVEVNELSIFI